VFGVELVLGVELGLLEDWLEGAAFCATTQLAPNNSRESNVALIFMARVASVVLLIRRV
jgi:hypothetical protein